MNREKRLARIAGVLYLIVAVFGGFSELYVCSSVEVAGDASATPAAGVRSRPRGSSS